MGKQIDISEEAHKVAIKNSRISYDSVASIYRNDNELIVTIKNDGTIRFEDYNNDNDISIVTSDDFLYALSFWFINKSKFKKEFYASITKCFYNVPLDPPMVTVINKVKLTIEELFNKYL